MYKLLALITIFFTTVFLLSSCKDRQSSKIVFLYDMSDSITQDLRKSHLFNTEEVLNKVCGGDSVIWSSITNSPDTKNMLQKASLEKPTASNFSSANNEKNLTGFRKQIAVNIKEFLDSPVVSGTCVVDSLRLVEEKFKLDPNERKTVVIFSDMLEVCNEIDFEKNPITFDNDLKKRDEIFSQKVSATLRKMEEKAPLPNLEGIEVYIVSKTTEQYSKNYFAVKKFWEGFFKETKANLIQYNTEINFRPDEKCPQGLVDVITGK